MYKKLVILLLMSTLFGFNIIQFIEKQRTKRWERSDIVYSLFSNEKGNHSVYSRLSDKPKIVFLHGFGASSLLQWYDVARLLKNDYDLIMPDLLCSGESAVIDNDYTVDAQVEHVKFVIEQLGVKEKVIVCGNSYGGLVASHFADKYPEMVSHLIMYDAPSKHYSLQHADSVARSLGLTGIGELLMPPNPEAMRTSLKVIYYNEPFIPDFVMNGMFEPEVMEQRKEQQKLLDDLISREIYYQQKDYNFKMPVSLIWGQYDELIPITTAKSIMEEYEIPEERLYIIPNTAHAANMEVPKEFCKVLCLIVR